VKEKRLRLSAGGLYSRSRDLSDYPQPRHQRRPIHYYNSRITLQCQDRRFRGWPLWPKHGVSSFDSAGGVPPPYPPVLGEG
jgi:hypothetical protein